MTAHLLHSRDLNSAWQKRSLRHVWHPCTQMQRAEQMPPLP